MNDGPVYLDCAATTRVDAEVAAAALYAMTTAWGNPSSAHRVGGAAAQLLKQARERVALAIGGAPAEIVFTSGGTEANALAVLGAARRGRRRHLVISALEHPSVSQAAQQLSGEGFELTIVPPAPSGVVDPERLAAAVRGDTALCALMWVQNELGSVQPVAAAARAVKARDARCHFHVDAVQAVGKLPVDVGGLGIDSLALSAHKIHGPKGVGALWLRSGAQLAALWTGGGQERGLRGGTESVPLISALGLAIEKAEAARPGAARRMAAQRDALWQAASEVAPRARRNVPAEHAAPHILSIGFPGVPPEPLLHALEAAGVVASVGSACAARDRKVSAALRAIGLGDDIGTLRLSLSRETRDEDVAAFAPALRRALETLA